MRPTSRLSKLFQDQPRFRLVVVSFLFILGGAGVGKVLDEPVPWSRVGVGIGICLAAFWVQWQTKSIYRPVHNLRQGPAHRRAVLILFLSKVRETTPSYFQSTGDLEADLRTLAERKATQYAAKQRVDFWSWEPTLRGILHNHQGGQGPLSRLVIVGSRESVCQLHSFVNEVLHGYPALRDHVRLQAFSKFSRRIKDLETPAVEWSAQNGFDFEDFDELTDALDEIIRQLRDEHGVAARDIQIDFTGGQKPTSVVGAVVTLFSAVANQYVSTNPCDLESREWKYEVLGYDFREETVPEDAT